MGSSTYYVPEPSKWPLVGSIAIFTTLFGISSWIHGASYGHWMTLAGFLILIYMFFGWFGEVIHESMTGCYDEQVDMTFRWSMGWFIFSEVMFFGAFFGALFYARIITVPQLAGAGEFINTKYLLWPHFENIWPLLSNPDNSAFEGPEGVIHAFGVPVINTLILLTSGATITWAHWGLNKQNNKQLVWGLIFTVLLGIAFLILQAAEYHEAYTELGLRLDSGIYGTTFFMLTGFHGLHVTFGTIMLIVITVRAMKKHFTPHNHFAFEAVAWYWHFVDVVWLLLFVLVYWL